MSEEVSNGMTVPVITCGRCKQPKDITHFAKRYRNLRLHRQVWCRSCKREYQRDYRAIQRKAQHCPHKVRVVTPKPSKPPRQPQPPVDPQTKANQLYDGQLRRNYGITLEEYNSRVVKQKGVCAICKKSTISKRRLAVDHCHTTGKVRGLLCSGCNTALGQVRDDTTTLRAMIAYLQTYQDLPVC